MSDTVIGDVISGTTSLSWPFTLTVTTTGAPETGKVASDMTAYYWRQGGSPTSISLSDLAAITSSYSSGGVKEAANMQGSYRMDVPDAAIAAGVPWVEIAVSTSDAFYQFFLKLSATVAVDLQTIKTQSVTCAGGVTIPAATLASTTNITAATGITVSTNSDKTGYSLANGSFVTATFGTCDFTTTMKTSLAAVPVLAQLLTFIQSDGGAGYQFTTTGLALAPTGGSAPTAIQNADALLKRDWTAISGESNYSVLQALRFLRNVWNTTDTPGTLTVMKEDGTTTAWTRPIDTDAAALPITGVE